MLTLNYKFCLLFLFSEFIVVFKSLRFNLWRTLVFVLPWMRLSQRKKSLLVFGFFTSKAIGYVG